MSKKVILWRHGQTTLNVEGRIQGATDIPLNEVGIKQARDAASFLVVFEPEKIVSSPLKRAYVTAQALGERLGLEVSEDARLIERSFGVWEGMSGKEIEAAYPQQYRAWRSGKDPEGVGVELRADVGKRVREAIEEWSDRTEGTLVIVAHGAALKCGITAMLGEDPSTWAGISVMSNCHWAVLEPLKDCSLWRLAAYNVGDMSAGKVNTPT